MAEEFFTDVQKRDGRFVPFNEEKIANAIFKAAKSVGGKDYDSARNIARKVTNDLRRSFGSKSPTIEEVQDSVEKILIEDGRAKTAKAFILYRDERKRMRSKIQVRKKIRGKASSTDLLLLVEPSSKDELFEWSKSKIASALHKEASIPLAEAEEIADAVEERIFKSGLKKISTSLIRALVDTELFDRGYQSKLEKQTLIGMPVYDLKQLISSMSNENSNVAANNPEAVNLSIAENILKQFALNNLFSKDISKAHLEGAIHLHDLGYPIRTYCSAHSLEYIKKYGLKLENLSTVSAPAKHAQTLTGHLNTFLASMQAYYAGALGISYVNLFYAPLMRGMSFERMKQEAQYLIFSCSQNAFSRGGQSLVPEETVWIREGNSLRQIAIGNLVDEFVDSDEGREEWVDGTMISRNNFKALDAVSFDEEGKISYGKISAFARIPFKGKIYSIKTSKGEIKGVTGSHAVFVWDGKRFESKKAEELKKNDYIVTALNAKNLVEENSTLDLVSFYLNRGEAGNEVRVYDVEERFKKALLEKYGARFYKEFERQTGVKPECVRSNWLRYKKIPLKYYFEFVGNPGDEKLIYVGDSQAVFPARVKITKSLVRLLGYYMSEGHNNPKRKSFVGISNKDEKFVEKVKECLIDLGYPYAVGENKATGVKLVAIQGIFAKLISDLGEDKEGIKQIPSLLYSLPEALQKEFLNAFYEGDGLKTRNCFAVANTSENVVNGIAMLFAMNGMDFNLFKKTYSNTQWKPCYELRESLIENRVIDHKMDIPLIGKKGFRKRLKNLTIDVESRSGTATQQINLFQMLMDADVGFARIKEITTSDYDGFVYDISVPGNESFLGGTGLIFFHNTLFIDFNIHTGIPSYLKNVPAIGPGGKYMLEKKDGSIEKLDEVPRNKDGELKQSADGKILTYLDFEAEAQQFCRALMEVWREGDRNNLPFPFPKFDLHVNQDSFDDPKQRELLNEACVIASENGSPYFIFDRDEVNLSMCCRLRTEITDNYMVLHPESMRFCGFQNVSINLPQAAFKSSKNTDKTIKTVEAMMDLAVKAHLQKKKFIDKLMSAPHMPLWQIGKVAEDGRKYVDTDKATYIIGIIGLNECVKYLTDKELHESEDAYKEGLKIISAMYLKAKALEKEHNLKFTLEETPAESASSRMAKVDLRRFDFVKDYVQGDVASENVYYTNSVHFSPNSEVDIIERIDKQAKFNTLIESGAITHVFLGEQKPDPAAIFELVKRTWDNTPSAQIVISPEFTICKDCDKISRGFVRSTVQATEEESSTEKDILIKKENSEKSDKSSKSKKSVAEVC